MTTEELYDAFDRIVRDVVGATPVQHFLFDLTDRSSQDSLRNALPGIESTIPQDAGNYLVAAPVVERDGCLVLLFPEWGDGRPRLKAFDSATGKAAELSQGEGWPMDFSSVPDRDQIADAFNQFAYAQDLTPTTPDEVVALSCPEVGEPTAARIPAIADNEDDTMKFKPLNEEEATKWVAIPQESKVTVEDGEEAQAAATQEPAPAQDNPQAASAPAEDPFAGGEAQAEPAAAEEAPAEAPAEETPAIDDPKAKMRELLAYYTNYLSELAKDPNTSTDLLSATQEMISSLMANMESADGIDEVKAKAEEEAKEEATASTEPANEGLVKENPAALLAAATAAQMLANEEGDDAQAEMDRRIDAEVDAAHADDWEEVEPATTGAVLTPGDIANSPVNSVDLSDEAPTPDEELDAARPDDSVQAEEDPLDGTDDPTPEEEDDLLGKDDAADFGPDGLPVDTFDGEVDDIGKAPAPGKVAFSIDYVANGIPTTADNEQVVPATLAELAAYYKKVADEVSKVPGKEAVAMKLQKVGILTQTIQNEWNSILGEISGCCASSFDRSNMTDLEKDEVDLQDGFMKVGQDVMDDEEQQEEDDLAIATQIDQFAESFKHLI